MKFNLVESLDNILVEEWLDDNKQMLITDNDYQVKSIIQANRKMIRIVYDDTIKMYMVCDAYNYIHEDMLQKALEQGWYGDKFKNFKELKKSGGRSHIVATYQSEFDNELIGDGYDNKYVYESGACIYTKTDRKALNWEDVPLSAIMGPYETFQCYSYNRGFVKTK